MRLPLANSGVNSPRYAVSLRIPREVPLESEMMLLGTVERALLLAHSHPFLGIFPSDVVPGHPLALLKRSASRTWWYLSSAGIRSLRPAAESGAFEGPPDIVENLAAGGLGWLLIPG